MRSPEARARLLALALAGVATIVGLGARAVLEGLPAKYIGDACWSLDVYALVRLLGPRQRIRVTAAIALLVSFAVEFLQLTPLPAYLSSRHLLLRLLLGSAFHATDLPFYALAVAIAAALDRAVLGPRRRVTGRQEGPTSDPG